MDDLRPKARPYSVAQSAPHQILVCKACRHKGDACKPGFALLKKLRDAIRADREYGKSIGLRYHDGKPGIIEGLLSRGDRRVSAVIEQAWRDGNGHSHLQASILGPTLATPISGGAPVLGTWQQIFHLECDVRPRSREIVVTVTG